VFKVAAACLLCLGCAHGAVRRPTTHAARDETLRRALLARAEADQSVRRLMEALTAADVERMIAVDTANTAWLETVIAKHGWPGRSVVGDDGTQAAFLIVQHADRDTAFQARVLPLLEQAYAVGEADGQEMALLTDRLASARMTPQVYGTQADLIDGRVRVKPIADSAHVDERRARVGLPPLTEYVRMLDSVYSARPRSR